MASVHDKLGRVRKPRVHIKYKVETGNATPERELPFVVGVLGDFAGMPNPKKPLKDIRDREFVTIHSGNFDTVLGKMAPQLELAVPNRIQDSGGDIGVKITFESLDDFEPARIVKNIQFEGQAENEINPLQKLLNIRNDLRDLLAKAHRSEDLEKALEKILGKPVEDNFVAKDKQDFAAFKDSLDKIAVSED